MASARRLRDGKENGVPLLEEEEAAFCLMLTNAVAVQDREGRALGIAVYDTSSSWVNHSCSANACYRERGAYITILNSLKEDIANMGRG